jgi:hypothetical protein
MTDIEIQRSGEFEVAHVGGVSDAGEKFIDSYLPSDGEFVVVDAGRVVVKNEHLDDLLARCRERGLEVSVEKVA